MQYRWVLPGMIVLLVLMAACVPVEEKRSAAKDAKYHYLLGVTALNEQNPTEALKEFLLAEKYDDEDPEIQAGLAQAYWQKKAFDLSEKHFLQAIEISDNDPKYYNNLGALYLSMERYDEAITAFRTAADNLLFDRSEIAWTGIGLAYFHKQDYPAAQRAYEKAMELNPSYQVPLFRLGELYYSQDRPVEALDMFTRSVELEPGFFPGFYWQGLVFMKIRDTEEAKKSFQEVIRLAPGSELARLSENYLKIIGQ
jgi:type IV pilus biogenesis/stability protein PilW